MNAAKLIRHFVTRPHTGSTVRHKCACGIFDRWKLGYTKENGGQQERIPATGGKLVLMVFCLCVVTSWSLWPDIRTAAKNGGDAKESLGLFSNNDWLS